MPLQGDCMHEIHASVCVGVSTFSACDWSRGISACDWLSEISACDWFAGAVAARTMTLATRTGEMLSLARKRSTHTLCSSIKSLKLRLDFSPRLFKIYRILISSCCYSDQKRVADLCTVSNLVLTCVKWCRHCISVLLRSPYSGGCVLQTVHGTSPSEIPGQPWKFTLSQISEPKFLVISRRAKPEVTPWFSYRFCHCFNCYWPQLTRTYQSCVAMDWSRLYICGVSWGGGARLWKSTEPEFLNILK
jgi:hypothetical protein